MPWTILQDNANYVNRPYNMEGWREEVRPMVYKPPYFDFYIGHRRAW